MKINDRRGRTLIIEFVSGPLAGILSSSTHEAEANMVWLLTNYGRTGSEFIRMSPVAHEADGATLDPYPPVQAHRYRVSERVESETEVRLVCHYKSQV